MKGITFDLWLPHGGPVIECQINFGQATVTFHFVWILADDNVHLLSFTKHSRLALAQSNLSNPAQSTPLQQDLEILQTTQIWPKTDLCANLFLTF